MAPPETTSRTWLLTGIPRSGSFAVCCRLAAELPNVVALSEPIGRDVSGSARGPGDARDLIVSFASRTQSIALTDQRVPTVHVDGCLDDNRDARAISPDGLRTLRGSRGSVPITGDLAADFTLFIKHNALFAALLPVLTPAFPLCGDHSQPDLRPRLVADCGPTGGSRPHSGRRTIRQRPPGCLGSRAAGASALGRHPQLVF